MSWETRVAVGLCAIAIGIAVSGYPVIAVAVAIYAVFLLLIQ